MGSDYHILEKSYYLQIPPCLCQKHKEQAWNGTNPLTPTEKIDQSLICIDIELNHNPKEAQHKMNHLTTLLSQILHGGKATYLAAIPE